MSGALADRRRNLGPTDLQVFEVPFKKDEAAPSVKLRPMFISQGMAAHASGSAYLEVGDIKLHATVHGPQQDRGDFNDSAKVEVNVNVENFAGISAKDDVEQTTSDFIRSSITPIIALKQYPKSSFVISLNILSGVESGSQLAASINVVTMALVNAGVALHDMVTGVSVSKTDDGAIYLDADFKENTPGLKQIVASYSTVSSKLVSMMITSQDAIAKEDVTILLDQALSAARDIRQVLNSYLIEDYVKAYNGST